MGGITNIWLSHTHISYAICNFYGDIINHKGCFLLTLMQSNSPIRTIENGFWGKKGKIWLPGQTGPKGTHQPPKHIFGWIERKSTLLRVSCGRVEGNKKWKTARETTISPLCPPHPHLFAAATVFCLWGRTVDVIINMPNFKWIGWGVSESIFSLLTWHIAHTLFNVLQLWSVNDTQEHCAKLYKSHTPSVRDCKIFCNPVINAWNSLPDAVVSYRSVAVLKRNLQSLDFSAV